MNGEAADIANDSRAALASLGAQVKGLENDYTDLKVAVVGLDRKLDTGLANINSQLLNAVSGIDSRFSAAISGINSKLDERGRTQWPALGVMLTGFIAFVAFAYWPIHSSQEDIKLSLAMLTKDYAQTLVNIPEHYVNYREHERLVKEIEASNINIHHELVSRDEHKNHWDSIRDREDAIQKQVDTIKQDFGAVWTSRDQMLRMQHELDDARQQFQRSIKPQ